MDHNLLRSIRRVDRRHLALAQALMAGLVALAALAFLFGSGDAASLGGRDMDLKKTGRSWELNTDSKGQFWISDYQAGEIWHLNPGTDVYTSYRGLDGASDGRLDANSDLWWVDFDNYRFARLDLDSNMRTIWPLTGTIPGLAVGLNFDDQGRVWMPDGARSDLYRFDPLSNEFCHFRLPNNSASRYIESHDGFLWLADWKLPFVYRIDPADGSYVQWFYARSSGSRGMTFDADGNLWWGGFDRRPALFQLDPNSVFVTHYNLPGSGGAPAMVDAHHNLIWYSDYMGRFGRLDPRQAVGDTRAATKVTDILEGVCYQDWQALSSSANTQKSTASAEWFTGAFTVTNYTDGWQVYELPESALEWGPWGIRARDDGIWVVDQVRQKLVHVPWQKLYVPLITK